MMKVLFIDDDRIVLALITCLLPEESFQVLTATSVAEAWQILAHTQPDVICCDLIMPGAGGLDFLSQYQQRQALEAAPVVILSGTDEQSLLDEASALGATTNLSKPFTGQDLITLLNHVTHFSPL